MLLTVVPINLFVITGVFVPFRLSKVPNNLNTIFIVYVKKGFLVTIANIALTTHATVQMPGLVFLIFKVITLPL
jgi:hypothetical protein